MTNITAEDKTAPNVRVSPSFSEIKNLAITPANAATAMRAIAVYFRFISFEPLPLSSKNATISGGAIKNIS